jgi:predicted aspartyl protease
MKLWTAVVGMLCLGSAAAQTPDELRKMMDANQAFALRDAVERQGNLVPVFYRGAVEASQNEIGPAQKNLEQVIRNDPHSKEAADARDALANMESRIGHYREALHWVEDAIAATGSEDAKNVLPSFRAFAEAGDMKAVSLKSSIVDCKDGLSVVINGKTETYGFDTGGAQSVIGESDAKMLGLALQHVETKGTESSGTAIPGFDVAVAKDVVIGGLHLRNVPFIVLQDTGEPFVHYPVGQRGLLGLPVLMAMQEVSWQPTLGRFEFGPKARVTGRPLRNLLFDGATPIVKVDVNGKPLIFSLDTGAVGTDLNEGFAKALPDLVKAGQKEIRPITGYGGTNNYDSVLLGPVVFRIGGLDATLKSPHVFPSHSLGKFDGNLGNDILNQAKTVVLDFEAMELRLE